MPFDINSYSDVVRNHKLFRNHIDGFIDKHPEIFPKEITDGYYLKDIYHSKKLDILKRRIDIGGVFYSVRPSFVLPYMTSTVSDAEGPLFFRKFDVPFWALEHYFGRDSMHWYRMEQSLGRYSLVGTTISKPELLPDHISADEKHTKLCGEKAYVPMTVGEDCILGISIADSAGDDALLDSYSDFKNEAIKVDPDYSPKTVNNDGWASTVNAWKNLFPKIISVLCFLHVYIKIRKCSKKKLKESYQAVVGRLWNAYKAKNRRSFSQRVRRLYEYCQINRFSSQITDPILKLKENVGQYGIAYEYPGAHRTSNMLDRLMNLLDRHLFNMRYFHGEFQSAELSLRGWALIYNFAPSCPESRKRHGGKSCPAERINGFRYRENWLENLLVSASLQGKRTRPLNPLYQEVSRDVSYRSFLSDPLEMLRNDRIQAPRSLL